MNKQKKMDEYWESYRRASRARDIAAFFCLLFMLAAIALLIGTIWKQVRENAPRPVSICTTTPLAAKKEQQPEEDPLETEHINEALFATGYLREDVPLSIGDQLALRASADWYGVPYSLCLGVIEGECNFNADNDDGRCYGLFALNRDYFPDDLEQWQVIQYGVELLADKLAQYNGDVPAALEAYWHGHDDGRRGYPEYILEFAEKWEALGVDHYEAVT